MALLAFHPENTDPKEQQHRQQLSERRTKHKTKQKQKQQPSSWDQIKNLLTCKQIQGSTVHHPSKTYHKLNSPLPNLASSCASICPFRDVVHSNTRAVHRPDNSPETSSLGHPTGSLGRRPATGSVSSRSYGSASGTCSLSSRAMQFRKLSGCYECRTVVAASRYPFSRSTICACSQCGEVFPRIESLELHQAVRHAVLELGQEDSGRNIVEIIFKSSWLKKDNPICKIDRILKVHNTQKTIQRFENCRDAVKARALNSAIKNPRCAADGNELLRFHCTTLSCSLGARGSSSLCTSVPGCGVCTIIRHGFQGKYSSAADLKGVRTTASSGRAHDSLRCGEARRAMLVCRVIAGRVRQMAQDLEEEGGGPAGAYDSLGVLAGVYSNLEELIVFNPGAILPCFVVVYKALQS